MPIVSRTLLAGQSETWFFTGSGFSIVSASGLLSRIEFLRQQKTVEDLVGSFGEGFYFQTPPGSIFDGVRITAQTTGTYSVFIGHGVAGIIETDNAKPVTVTNSEIAVDVQNAILNTQIQNSSLDVDIITDIVNVNPNDVGVFYSDAAATSVLANYGSNQITSASVAIASGNVAAIEIGMEIYANTPPTVPYGIDFRIRRGSTVLYEGAYSSAECNALVYSPLRVSFIARDGTAGSNTYNFDVKYNTTYGGGTTAPYMKNRILKVTQ